MDDSSRDGIRADAAEPELACLQVMVREGDRALIESVARRLAEGGPEAIRLRQAIGASETPASEGRVGGIYAALRRSPLVGADLDLTRPRVAERAVEL